MIASFVIALAGVVIGAVAAYVGERGAAARAARTEAMNISLRDAPLEDAAYLAREKIVQRVLSGAVLERLPVPEMTGSKKVKPKVIIVFDDMGIDRRAFEQVAQLPGPLTLAFLPYAKDVDALADQAREAGLELMLHLPMQPQGSADPGPHALKADMTGAAFLKELEWNLNRFDGYVGVNNHMGSKLTTDEAAMKTVLAYLKHEGLFFLDSVTTGDTVVRSAGAMVDARILSRDVFIDAEDSKIAIIRLLELVERIAIETGYVIAICHPRQATIDILGPWLTSAPYRGFDVTTLSALIDFQDKQNSPLMVEAPALRL